MIMKKYKKVALGGTFDHFHKGHQHFLLAAMELAESLIVGVTTPELHQSKAYSSTIESYEKREKSVKDFLKNLFIEHSVIPLNDIYGPTLAGSTVEALVATTDTEKGTQAINRKRKDLDLNALPIHLVELAKDESGGIISSECIRAGKINRSGKVYRNVFEKNLVISDDQKAIFSQPQGDVVEHPSTAAEIYVVGDYCLKTFREYNWSYDLAVFDHKMQRKSYAPVVLSNDEADLEVKNTAGEISLELVAALEKAQKQQLKHILVEGEEDLAAVALVLLAPLGSNIYYGQPNKGMVEINVDEAFKEKIHQILSNNH